MDSYVTENLNKRIETRLPRLNKVVFVIKGEKGKGLGHCYRAWTIAQSLPSFIESKFVLTPNSSLGLSFCEQKNISQYQLAASDDDLLNIIAQAKPDLIINDVLNTSEAYVSTLKKLNTPIINFEDLGTGGIHADCVINAVYPKTGLGQELSGHDYVDIRKEFFLHRKISNTLSPSVRSILLTFGGEDPSNLTQKTLEVIARNDYLCQLNYVIALGGSYQQPKEVMRFIQEKALNAEVFIGQDIAPLMAQVDMAITANCRTVFEAAFMRLPTVVISANARECLHTFYRDALFPYCGNGQLVDHSVIEHQILRLATNNHLRRTISNRLQTFDLSNGMNRIINQIIQLLNRSSSICNTEYQHITEKAL